MRAGFQSGAVHGTAAKVRKWKTEKVKRRRFGRTRAEETSFGAPIGIRWGICPTRAQLAGLKATRAA
jgi:hypothetical protein